MGLGALTKRGRGLQELSRAEWPFAAAKFADALEAELSNHQTLMMIADRLCHLAHELDVEALVGASAVGDRLAGAVVAAGNGSLRLWSDQVDATPARLMIISGVINTGAELARSFEHARGVGVVSAVGAAVIGNRSAIDAWRHRGLQLIALEEI